MECQSVSLFAYPSKRLFVQSANVAEREWRKQGDKQDQNPGPQEG